MGRRWDLATWHPGVGVHASHHARASALRVFGPCGGRGTMETAPDRGFRSGRPLDSFGSQTAPKVVRPRCDCVLGPGPIVIESFQRPLRIRRSPSQARSPCMSCMVACAPLPLGAGWCRFIAGEVWQERPESTPGQTRNGRCALVATPAWFTGNGAHATITDMHVEHPYQGLLPIRRGLGELSITKGRLS